MKANKDQDYQTLDGGEFIYKRANSRTPRKAAFANKLTKRRKARKAARSKKRGN